MRAATLNEKDGVWTQTVPVKEFYSVQDTQVILNVGGPSIYSAIKRGTLKGVRLNNVVHIRHAALLEYLSRRSSAPLFDPNNLVVEDIVPEKDALKATATMTPSGEFDDDFMDD